MPFVRTREKNVGKFKRVRWLNKLEKFPEIQFLDFFSGKSLTLSHRRKWPFLFSLQIGFSLSLQGVSLASVTRVWLLAKLVLESKEGRTASLQAALARVLGRVRCCIWGILCKVRVTCAMLCGFSVLFPSAVISVPVQFFAKQERPGWRAREKYFSVKYYVKKIVEHLPVNTVNLSRVSFAFFLLFVLWNSNPTLVRYLFNSYLFPCHFLQIASVKQSGWPGTC